VVDGPAAEQAALSFGGLLRRLRDEAGLTQDELAGAAQVSQRAISDLERGINATARKDTAVLLAGALGLAGPVRALFVAAARGKAPAAEVLAAGRRVAPGAFAAAATRCLPRDIGSFTGRQAELGQLMARWAEAAAAAGGGGVVSVHAIGGMAGIGKTTFAVHAAHQLAGSFPDGQLFLPLHAHTPGQRPVRPADALASLLLTAGVPPAQIPPGVDARAARWRDHAAGKKILLVLDDAAGHQQVRPLLPGTPGSLVLITGRRRLAALEDAAVVSLDTLTPHEAADLLARLADRPGVTADDPAVGQLAKLCGYLPLAIGIAGRQLAHHPAWTPAGLADDLAAARDRLELMAAENVSVAAAFGLSYADLDHGQQQLFRRLGLVPGPSFDAYAACALHGTTLDAARRCLDELYDQHLITEPAPGRYQLHDLLREHAQTLAAADDPATSEAAAGRLLDYYLHTALAAGKHFASWWAAGDSPPPGRPPACVPPVSTHRQAAAWLEAERANLHAAVGCAATAGFPRHATAIPAAMESFLDARCYWDQSLGLQQMAVDTAYRAGDRPDRARALMRLSGAQCTTEDYPAATASATRALELYRDLGHQAGQGDALGFLGLLHRMSGDYPAAAVCLQQALRLFLDAANPAGQAIVLTELGAVHSGTGDYPAAATSHQQALGLFRSLGHRPGQGYVLTLLGTVYRLTGDYPAAAATLEQASALHREFGDGYKQAMTLIELGVIQRLTGDYRAAAASHRQALRQLSDLGERAGQAGALNELGLVQQLTGDYPAAAASHQQALALFGDLGARDGQAEALNSLGDLSSRTSDSQQALGYHRQALTIAHDIGAPLEEARALEGIGRCHLQDGHAREATAHLQRALTIYQHIGAPDAQRVQQTLQNHELASTSKAQPAAHNNESHQTSGDPGTGPARSTTE
jgi:tetratricopeptide (TPR) repeat protein/transcriptional regulator with XRE-family HTH domain